MTNQELYKQAILDAKAVRETALAAAKQSLSEAFEPRIMEMMRLKLSEELEEGDDNMEESKEEMEEAMNMSDEGTMKDESDMVDENTLDEILAELNTLAEEMEEGDETIEEGHINSDGYTGKGGKGSTGYDHKAGKSSGDHKLHEADDQEEADEEAEEADEEAPEMDTVEGGEEAADDETVVDITVGELKDIIRDVFMQLQGGGMEAPEMGEPATDDENGAIALDGEPEEKGMEEISLEEILAELENDEPASYTAGKPTPVEEAKKKEDDKMKKDLEEANKAVKAMQMELNEINLLNAKLLYFNKILKAKSLNESQKVKVMNAFDRAVSVKEVENTYKTLNESITAPKKTALKESMGFASKAIGSAPSKPIVEVDSMVARWKTIAGIK